MMLCDVILQHHKQIPVSEHQQKSCLKRSFHFPLDDLVKKSFYYYRHKITSNTSLATAKILQKHLKSIKAY